MDLATVLKGIRHPRAVPPFLLNRLHGPRLEALERLHSPKEGIHLFEEDWDNLILLDACRFDVFESVNSIEGELSCRRSRGEATPAFIDANFAGERHYDTVVVSANAMLGKYSEKIDVYKLVGLWGDGAPADRAGGNDDNTDPRSLVDPVPVVEKAKALHEEYPDKRLVVHFLQPHTPFLVKDGTELGPDSPYRTFDAVRRGEVSEAEIRAVYRENLEYVLGFVREVIEHVDGKTVVSADHGELLGEGIPLWYQLVHPRWSVAERRNFRYAHYNHVRVPELTDVPWLELPFESRRSIVTDDAPEGVEIDETAITAQLEELGYV